MKLSCFVFALIMYSGSCSAFAQSISFTFDDPLDSVAPGQSKISRDILKTLRKQRLKATLFVCGMRVDSAKGIDLIKDWQADGHEIGNHTYSHRNFNSKISFEEFALDAKKNEDFMVANGFRPTRFRFPYLKEGNTTEKRDQMRAWLEERGYQSGAVSVDASDWYYDERLITYMKHKGGSIKAFRQAYLDHIWERANYYHTLAKDHLERSPSLVLLLHVNTINSKFLKDAIEMFRAKGWETVDSSVSYQDPIYATQPDIIPAGESLIWQIAKQNGDESLRYPGEDAPYEKPILDRLGL